MNVVVADVVGPECINEVAYKRKAAMQVIGSQVEGQEVIIFITDWIVIIVRYAVIVVLGEPLTLRNIIAKPVVIAKPVIPSCGIIEGGQVEPL